MNSNQTPAPGLVMKSEKPPKSLVFIYSLLAIAFICVIIDYTIVIDMDGRFTFDSGNYLSVVLWSGILAMLGKSISIRKYNPMWLIMVLAVTEAGIAIVYYQGFPVVIANIAEATCYLVVFTILRKPEYEEWFKKNT
jgi:hypothetical protein